MRRSPVLLAALLAACAQLPVALPAPAPPPSAPTADGPAAMEEFVAALNRHRARRGCPALAWHEGAARVARAHSEDMQRRRYFSHTSPEGRTLRERLTAAGIRPRGAAGENLADTWQHGRELLQFWLESPGHRANIESCEYTHHGLGQAGRVWTHVFLQSPAPG